MTSEVAFKISSRVGSSTRHVSANYVPEKGTIDDQPPCNCVVTMTRHQAAVQLRRDLHGIAMRAFSVCPWVCCSVDHQCCGCCGDDDDRAWWVRSTPGGPVVSRSRRVCVTTFGT